MKGTIAGVRKTEDPVPQGDPFRQPAALGSGRNVRSRQTNVFAASVKCNPVAGSSGSDQRYDPANIRSLPPYEVLPQEQTGAEDKPFSGLEFAYASRVERPNHPTPADCLLHDFVAVQRSSTLIMQSNECPYATTAAVRYTVRGASSPG